MTEKPIDKVEFAELSDGSLVEIIESVDDNTKTQLAVYRDGSVRYAERIEEEHRILKPLPRTDPHLQHVCLAQGAEPYGQTTKLMQMIGAILNECLDIETQGRTLISAFVMSTWLPERLSVAPYLAFVGLPGSGKTTAIQILSLLCYRSLLTTDITSAGFYEISNRIRPTILLDETLTAYRQRELTHLLRASNTRGFVSLRKDKARLAYGPKVVTWLELPSDPALNSRCIIVPMHKSSRIDLKRSDDPLILKVAAHVRKCLLQFRFDRFRNLSVAELPADVRLSGRPLDLYRALTLPFDRDEETCKILGMSIARQSQFHADMLPVMHTSVIRILHDVICADPEAPGLPLKALNKAVNLDLRNHGEAASLTPRKLGDILTCLSFSNRTRRNNGYFLWLKRSDRERIHTTARDFGIEGSRADSIEDCKICSQASKTAESSGRAESQTKEKVLAERSGSELRERRERARQRRRLRIRRAT